MNKEFTFDELRKLVVSIWLIAKPDLELENWDGGEDGEYQFKDFLRGHSYGIPEVDRVQYIQHEGGGEGGGEHCESVIQVDGVFYMITYIYASYDGFYWDDAGVEVVQPVERTVVFYEPIKE